MALKSYPILLSLLGVDIIVVGNLYKGVCKNLKRFPQDSMFHLNKDEFKKLDVPKWNFKLGGTKKIPYAFTAQGLAMLSGVLNVDRAYSGQYPELARECSKALRAAFACADFLLLFLSFYYFLAVCFKL